MRQRSRLLQGRKEEEEKEEESGSRYMLMGILPLFFNSSLFVSADREAEAERAADQPRGHI